MYILQIAYTLSFKHSWWLPPLIIFQIPNMRLLLGTQFRPIFLVEWMITAKYNSR